MRGMKLPDMKLFENNLKDNAISVHYVGPDKPWMDNEDKRYSELNNVWRSYASGTPIPLPEAV